MAERIRIEPQPEYRVPGVSFAPVQVKPSPIATFTEAIMPGIKKAFVEPAETGADILGDTISAFQKQITDLEEAGTLTDIAFNRTLSEYRVNLVQSLIRGGVDPKLYSGLREAFNFALAKDQRFKYEKVGTATLTTDQHTGEHTVSIPNADIYAQMAVANTIVGLSDYDKMLLPQLEAEGKLQSFIEKRAEQQQRKEDLVRQTTWIENEIKLANYTDERRRQLTEDQYFKARAHVVTNVFDSKIEELANLVRAGTKTIEEAKAEFNAYYNHTFTTDPDTMQAFQKLGYSPDTVATELLPIKTDAAFFFESLDPTKKLSRDALYQQHKYKETIYRIKNGYPMNFKIRLAYADDAKNAAMSDWYIRNITRKDQPESKLLAITEQSSKTMLKFREGMDEAMRPMTKGEAMTKGSPFVNKLVMTLRTLDNLIADYDIEGADIARVEDALLMYSVLKDNPNWRHLSAKQLLEFEKRFRKIEDVFAQDSAMYKLLQDTKVEDRKTWDRWFEQEFGKEGE